VAKATGFLSTKPNLPKNHGLSLWETLPILFPGTKSAFCVVDDFVAEDAEIRMTLGDPHFVGHITRELCRVKPSGLTLT
jgi:hypothetical protein